MAFTDIHEEVFSYLREKREEIPDLVYRLRRTNRGNKLSDGYWFLGNDDYLSIGFWEGMNWRSKSPNISFEIYSDGRGCALLINTTDSEEKTKFIERELVPELMQSSTYSLYLKSYEGANWKESLDNFFYYDYLLIDNAIKGFYLTKKPKYELPFNIIDEDVFWKDFYKVLDYREEKKKKLRKEFDIKPCKLKSFEIFNYGPIKHCNIENIPSDTQWIFLTGENGVGKSSILKALAMAIGHRKMIRNEIKDNKGFKVNLELIGEGDDYVPYTRENNIGSNKIKPLSIGFAAYGPMRLQPINVRLSPNKYKDAKSKSGRFNSLFDNDGYLLDLENEFRIWDEKGIDISKRKDEITELLENVLVNVGKVDLFTHLNDIPVTVFQEIDEENNLLDPVTIEKLSSGYLSITAMVCDMLIRLFQQQPKVKDFGDLRGIVIIDEIDIHLHPKLQKHFVEQLTLAYPNVQFIASTHSPIPLLGAPKETVFLKIKRSKENGVEIERLKKLENEIKFLLPNTILTSDIFDFDILEDVTEEEFNHIYLEDNYDDIQKNKEIDENLKSIDKSIFPDDLFKDVK